MKNTIKLILIFITYISLTFTFSSCENSNNTYDSDLDGIRNDILRGIEMSDIPEYVKEYSRDCANGSRSACKKFNRWMDANNRALEEETRAYDRMNRNSNY